MPSNLSELRQMNVSKQRENAAKDAKPEGDKQIGDITSNTVSQSYDLLTDKPTDRLDSQQADRPASQTVSGVTGLPTDQPVSPSEDLSDARAAERQADKPVSRPPDIKGRIKTLTASSMTPVTLKMPSGINEYVDEYIHQNYKLKIKKQDVITRAMQLAIYELETGKELVKLDG